jgi:hypothetical protein
MRPLHTCNGSISSVLQLLRLGAGLEHSSAEHGACIGLASFVSTDGDSTRGGGRGSLRGKCGRSGMAGGDSFKHGEYECLLLFDLAARGRERGG